MDSVSIVIPAYNGRAQLEKVLYGIAGQAQSLNGVEIILADNGSTENISGLAVEFADHLNIRYVDVPIQLNSFQPGRARNLGASIATGEFLIFLDADCIPGRNFIDTHLRYLKVSPTAVCIGHRVFVDSVSVNTVDLRSSSYMLSNARIVKSASNYYNDYDRRIPELNDIAYHEAPYNCLHGCNFSVRKDFFVSSGLFNAVFDGYWGYEDIELGYRLWSNGGRFFYAVAAEVYHLESDSGLSYSDRLRGRDRNFLIACSLMPSFREFRLNLGR